LHILEDINDIKDITGFRFPCRIFEVKIVGKDWIKFDNKIKCKKLKVIKKLSIEEINKKLKNIRMINNSSAMTILLLYYVIILLLNYLIIQYVTFIQMKQHSFRIQ